MKQPRRRWMLAAGLAVLLAGFVALRWTWRRPSTYLDHFGSGTMAEWSVYGGSWLLTGDAITNDSDDTGAKVITGEASLRDITMDADVRLTSSFGDAGLIVRVTDPEEGTNAFNGYYAGIRLPDQLLLSRMDYGFEPLRRVTIASGVAAGTWYHLRLTAQGCHIEAEAKDMWGHVLARTDYDDRAECLPLGRFGLRSFSAGGSWRKIEARDR